MRRIIHTILLAVILLLPLSLSAQNKGFQLPSKKQVTTSTNNSGKNNSSKKARSSSKKENSNSKTRSTVMKREDQEKALLQREREKESNNESGTIYKTAEQMPQFPGGETRLMKYIASHIQYPTKAQKNNVQGKVIVQFVVTTTGQVGEVRIARSVDEDLDNEAVRVCKALPRFTPGYQDGKPVSVWYTLPINFKLTEEKSNKK